MFTTLLLASAFLAAEPPIAVRLSNEGRYMPGEGVRVTVRPADDGYLLVLHADPDGRVRILFPLDPVDDAFVRGGRDYALRSRGDRRDIFIADWQRGRGTILAAIARDPLQVGELAVNGHWDYRTLQLDQSLDDESALRELANRLAPGGFQYDVAPYVIGEASTNYVDGGTTVYTVGVGVGSCWDCGYLGWGVGWYGPGWGWNIGWGWGGYYPYYPYYPWYGYGYGWGWGGYYPPYYPGYPVYPGYPGGGYPPYVNPHNAKFGGRTWNGQPYGGGGVGVQGRLTPNGSLAGANGTGYRQRGGDIGVQGQLARTGGSSSYTGRRLGGGQTAPAQAGTQGQGQGTRRLAGGQEATAADAYRSGRRVDDGMPRDVSRGYEGADRPVDVSSYDRGARRRTVDGNAAGALPRDSRVDRDGTYPRATESYGRRAYDGTTGGGGSYERTRPRGQYDVGGGGSTYTGRGATGRSSGGRAATGQSYGGSRSGGVAPRGSSGGSRGGSIGGGGGGGSRGGSIGGGGGSRGGSMGGGGGGSRGGGYRGR